MKIASDGWPLILPAVILAMLGLAIGILWSQRAAFLIAAGAFLAAGFLLYFFRDPDRQSPTEAGLIISPADGRVVMLAEVEEPYFINSRAKQISIFMSPLDVHVNRAPCSGRVGYKKYYPGKYLPAFREKASLDNEQLHLGLETAGGRILMKQIAGILARRIICLPEVGEDVVAGQRLGLIKLGSRVDLFVPSSARISVALGQKVRAGETVIGRF